MLVAAYLPLTLAGNASHAAHCRTHWPRPNIYGMHHVWVRNGRCAVRPVCFPDTASRSSSRTTGRRTGAQGSTPSTGVAQPAEWYIHRPPTCFGRCDRSGQKPQPARLAGSGGEAVAEVAAARVVAVDYQCGPTESSHPKRGSSSSVPGVLAPSAGRCFSPSLCSSSGTAGASAPGTQCSCVDVLTPW